MGKPLALGEQISPAGVHDRRLARARRASAAPGWPRWPAACRAHRPDLLDGVGLIVGIDRFMSEARAVTNFSGNAVATMLVGSWTKTIDKRAGRRGAQRRRSVRRVDDGRRSRSTRRRACAGEDPCAGIGRDMRRARSDRPGRALPRVRAAVSASSPATPRSSGWSPAGPGCAVAVVAGADVGHQLRDRSADCARW